LPRPHVVREADTEAERGGESQPRHADLLIRAQRAPKISTGVRRREPGGPPQALERPRQPRTRVHARPPVARLRRGRVVRRGCRAREQAHAFEERQPAFLRLLPHAFPVRQHLAQPVAVELDPLPAQPHETTGGRRQERAHFGRRQLVVAQGDGHREIEQRVHADRARFFLPHADGHLRPRRPTRLPPVGNAHHETRRLESRHRAQESVRLVRGPRHGLVDGARIDKVGQPWDLLGGTLQWNEEVQQRLAIAARRGLLQRAGQRPMLHPAARAGAYGVRGEKAKGVLLVATVLGQVQAHLADGVPRRMARAEPVGDGAPMAADLVGEGPVDVRPPRRDPVGVDVLAAVHGRHSDGQPVALVGRTVDVDTLAPLLEIRHGAQPRHESAADIAQICQRRDERGVELGGAEVQ
jgi:hypothetical protein